MSNDAVSDSTATIEARLADGLVLPVVDVSSPAFRVDDSLANLLAWRAAIAAPRVAPPPAAAPAAAAPAQPLPELVQRMFAPPAGYLDGWATYLMKVGAENVPARFDSEIERRLLSSPNAMSLRVRLQQLATVMADALRDSREARLLRLVTIGGGTAIEALNALILLTRAIAPAPLPSVEIAVLDVDDEGSRLGEAALAALQQSGGLSRHIPARLRFFSFSWDEPGAFEPQLRRWVEEGAFVFASSEGALFEYGSDEVVCANLELLRGAGKVPVAGSVIRNDAAGEAMAARSPFTLYARGMPGIERLAGAAGYRVARVVEGVATDQFLLEAI